MLPLLNCYSHYSFLRAVASPGELVRAAATAGYREMALTDVNSLHGVVEFIKTAREEGLRALPGAEVSVAGHGRLLLLSGRDGPAPLVRTVNRASLTGQAPVGLLREGLVVLAGGESRIFGLLRQGHFQEALALTGQLAEALPREGLWLTLGSEQKLWPKLKELGEAAGVGLVACPPVRWTEAHQDLAYQVYQRIAPQSLPQGSFPLLPPQEVQRVYRHFPQALEGARRVAELAGGEFPLGKIFLPRFGPEDPAKLRQLCSQGFVRRWPGGRKEAWARLQLELEVIEGMGFSSYFLIAWDLVRFARERGITVGPGRGSAGGSLVAYLLDITRIEPLSHNLIFERFLNPQRVSLPDIDIDLCYLRRDEVFAYAVNRYGRDRTCQIATYSTYGPRGAVRDSGRALGLPMAEINALCRQIPGRGSLASILNENPRLREIAARQPWQRWFALAAQLEGRVRHTSVHAGGLLITPFPLDELVPLERAAGGDICSQWDKDAVEEMGLLKMDLLGVRGLTLNQRVVEEVGREQVTKKFSFRDKKTIALLKKGETLGCFQLESEGMRSLMRQMDPKGLEDVIAILSLYRPGPWQAGMVQRYIERRHGREEIQCYHPDLLPVLGDTYGVLLYQEQVMQVAQIIGGYTAGEADSLRRAMTKLRRDKMEELTQEFCARSVARGYQPELAETLVKVLIEFSGYAFNRAHSAAYGHLAMATVFLKAHWPDRFLAALLTTRMGYYPMQTYVNEAARLGIRVLPPCVNRSGVETLVEAPATIRLGLDYVKNLGEGARAIMAARGEKPFRGLADFLTRLQPTKADLENLTLAGALDSIEANRRALLAALPALGGKGSPGLLLETQVELPDLPDLSPSQRVYQQWASLGLLLDQGWLMSRPCPWPLPQVTCAELAALPRGREVAMLAAVVNRRRDYITLDDFSGQAEARYAGAIPARWLWLRGKAIGKGQFEPREMIALEGDK